MVTKEIQSFMGKNIVSSIRQRDDETSSHLLRWELAPPTQVDEAVCGLESKKRVPVAEHGLCELARCQKVAYACLSRGVLPHLHVVDAITSAVHLSRKDKVEQELARCCAGKTTTTSSSSTANGKLDIFLNDLLRLPPSDESVLLHEKIEWNPEERKLAVIHRKALLLKKFQMSMRQQVKNCGDPKSMQNHIQCGSVDNNNNSVNEKDLLQLRCSTLLKREDRFVSLFKMQLRRGLQKKYNKTLISNARILERARHAIFCKCLKRLSQHARELKASWQDKIHKALILARHAVRFRDLIDSKRAAEEERAERERLKLLKENNLEAYMSLVRNTKNRRLQELLNQTDTFLKDMGARVEIQKGSVHHGKVRPTVEATADEQVSSSRQPLTTEDVTNESAAVANSDEQQTDASSGQLMSRDLYYSLSHQIHESVRQPSILDGGLLLPYQITGLEWMVSLCNNGLHGILADEMGLGKTVQTISLFAYLWEYKANTGPHIVVAPLSTIPNWEAEFAKWCPTMQVVSYKGSKEERVEAKKRLKLGSFHVCLTTPEYVIRERATLSHHRWHHIVVDEGHRMKNAKSKFHINLNEFASRHRILLTGTPLQNNLAELWSLLNFLLPQVFSANDDFERWFNEPFSQLPSQEQEAALTEEEQLLIINRLHSVLRPFLLRRVKKDVLQDLPEKREHVVRVELSEWQKIAYRKIEERALKTVDNMGKVRNKSLQNHLMQLRKIVNHPYLFKEQYDVDHDIYRTAGKFEVLDRFLPKVLHFTHKVLIFCQMTRLMDILADYLEWRNISYLRLDGGVCVDERRDRMSEFNLVDSEKRVFILSTRAGGLGLNLQAADTVILFDSDFNPQQDLQAQNRAHRVGQTKEVLVFRLITLSPVEELVLRKAQHKLDIDEKIIQAGLFDTQSTDAERQKKLRTILEGKDMESDAQVTSPEMLNKMLARSDAELAYFDSFDEEIFDSQKKNVSNSGAGGEGSSSAASERSRRSTGTKRSRSMAASGGAECVSSKSDTGNGWLSTGGADMDSSAASFLVRCDRLMRVDEIPSYLVATDEDADYDAIAAELKPSMRRARIHKAATLDNMTEHQFLRMMEKIEEGEVENLEEAVELELQRREQKRCSKLMMHDEDEDGELYASTSDDTTGQHNHHPLPLRKRKTHESDDTAVIAAAASSESSSKRNRLVDDDIGSETSGGGNGVLLQSNTLNRRLYRMGRAVSNDK